MKVNMIYDESIKTFDDVCHHIEFKDECLEVAKSSGHSYVTKSSSRKDPSFKHKNKVRPSKKRNKAIFSGKRNLSNHHKKVACDKK